MQGAGHSSWTQAVIYPLIWLANIKTKVFMSQKPFYRSGSQTLHFRRREATTRNTPVSTSFYSSALIHSYMHVCMPFLYWTTYLMQGNVSLLRNLLSPKHSIPRKTSHHTLVCCTSSYFEPPNWNLNAVECYLTELTTRKPNITYLSNNHPA